MSRSKNRFEKIKIFQILFRKSHFSVIQNLGFLCSEVMDEKVAKWIIEFLLRKTFIDEKIINGVLLCLPISNNDNRLKKTILLRKIESELSNGSVSENLLELFEIIEELDHREGTRASDSMKKAYCAVAVDCTLRFLEENAKDNRSYVLAVERVWRNRVRLMEALVSEESKCWLEDIEAAIWDSEVCEKILMRNTRNEALKAVRGFLKEAWNSMGPAFLELVAAKVGDEVEALRHGFGSVNHCPKVMASQGVQKGQSLVRRKDVAVKTKHLRGAKISDAGEDEVGSINTANDVPIDEIEKVPETPQSNSLQLQADAGGFHPDTSQDAQNLSFTKDNDVPTHNIDSVLAPQLNSNVRACHSDVCQDTHNMSHTKDNELLPRTIEKLQAHQSSSVLSDSHPDGSRAACTKFVTKVTDNANGMKAAENRTDPVIQTPKVTRFQKALKTSVMELHEAPTEPLKETIQVAETLCSTGVTHNHKTAVENQAGVEKHAFTGVNRVQRALETSSVEVHAAGKNPGANASRTVENVSPKVATNNVKIDAVLVNQTQPGTDAPRESTKNNPKNVNKDQILEKIEGSDTHYPRELPKRKRSLMEPNSTSHTMEWDDIESRDLHAHSPSISKRSRSSALKLYDSRNFAIRRLRRKWTPQEEDTLRDGVKRFGRSWKYILECYREIFGDRTYVDLKDKWRNMTRYES